MFAPGDAAAAAQHDSRNVLQKWFDHDGRAAWAHACSWVYLLKVLQLFTAV
jgi:hypothetical protein